VGIFVDINNTVYAAAFSLNQVKVWLENSTTPTRIISRRLSNPMGLFVKTTGDIYVNNGANRRVDMWALNAEESVSVMTAGGECNGLFIDINNTLYCSMSNLHKVVKRSLNSSSIIPIIAAGTGSAGSTSNQLDQPFGIFVDTNFDLYVADCKNNRIQRFSSGQSNGITVAGNGTSAPITLNCPRGIMLDGDGYLFIVHDDYRIIYSGLNGFRCVGGCSGTSSSTSSQMSKLRGLAFDSYGNIFVTDFTNGRILKFILATNSCGERVYMTL
jgi:hypothetical protein